MSFTTAARAATCGVVVSDISIANIELRSGVSNQAISSLTFTSAAPLLGLVGACIRLGAGSGGFGTSNSPRDLSHGSGPGGGKLTYQLRPNGFNSSNGI
ncbi:hypothetical protein [Amylibacter marinus]|uniref:hypothetical protein n=1 Tax=Amylibacter marinus TaxID=1475483 RepID=UPI0024E11BD3|nr:hypothetical protein [Amylibacter marinus]